MRLWSRVGKMVKRLMKKEARRSRFRYRTLKSHRRSLSRKSRTRRRALIRRLRTYCQKWYHTSTHNMLSMC